MRAEDELTAFLGNTNGGFLKAMSQGFHINPPLQYSALLRGKRPIRPTSSCRAGGWASGIYLETWGDLGPQALAGHAWPRPGQGRSLYKTVYLPNKLNSDLCPQSLPDHPHVNIF